MQSCMNDEDMAFGRSDIRYTKENEEESTCWLLTNPRLTLEGQGGRADEL